MEPDHRIDEHAMPLSPFYEETRNLRGLRHDGRLVMLVNLLMLHWSHQHISCHLGSTLLLVGTQFYHFTLSLACSYMSMA